MDVAERLALWLNAFDAIGLQAAHRSVQAVTSTARPTAASPPAADLAAEFTLLRQTLAQAIARELAPAAAEAAADANYSRYRQRHAALQRQMDQMIATLREQARQTLAAVSPALRRLALLDAALAQVLAPREQALLPTLTAHLSRRFEQLRQAQAPGWEQDFASDWRAALGAELDLRLEPVAGLIDAWANELKKRA